MKWLRDLYVGLNTVDGVFSHTKFWSNVAYATATFIMVKLTYFQQLTADYFLIYLGVVAAHGTASKFITLKGAPKP